MHHYGVRLISILLTLSLVEIEICTACSRSFVVGDRGVGSVGVGAVSFMARAKESRALHQIPGDTTYNKTNNSLFRKQREDHVLGYPQVAKSS